MKYLFILPLFILIQCTAKEEYVVNAEEIKIDNTLILDSTDISSLIDTISLLPLIEDKNEPFAGVFKFIHTSKYNIIFDRMHSRKVLAFNLDGSFYKVVCKVGESLADALNISDIWIDKNGALNVYDYGQMKIFKYDSNLDFLTFVKSSTMYHFSAMTSHGDNIVGYSNFSDFNEPVNKGLYTVAFFDTTLKLTDSDGFYDKKYQGVLWPIFNSHFSSFKDSLRFIKAYDNTIYTISGTKLTPRYKILYSKLGLPENIMNEIKSNLEQFKDRETSPNAKSTFFKKYTFLQSPYFENERYLFLQSKDSVGKFGSRFTSFFDKNKKSIIFSARKVIDSAKYKMRIPAFHYYDLNDKCYYFVASSTELKSLLYSGSPFLDQIASNPNQFYLIKVKFNES